MSRWSYLHHPGGPNHRVGGYHPEPKSRGPDAVPRGTVGLLSRRPVLAGRIVAVGKEANDLERVGVGLVDELEEVQRV